MKTFKSKTTEKKFGQWLNSFPESWHPYDYERFHEFVTALLIDDDYISESELRNAIIELKEWKDKDFIDEFVESVTMKIDDLRLFFDHLKKIKIINAT
ncbi:MAG: hypothetical protein HQ522_15405 [Bacteroidetes bacterium]|nr:hypothetical protein [Bacteroidota bacterium]